MPKFVSKIAADVLEGNGGASDYHDFDGKDIVDSSCSAIEEM